MSQKVGSYVDICIWRALDKSGRITTSSEGWREGNSDLGRVGHGAICLVKDSNPTYMSFWPNKQNKLIGKVESVCVTDFRSDVRHNEKSDPDIIIRLYHLNIDKMLEAYYKIKERSDKGELCWSARVTDTEDATSPKCKRASCVSFVWTILRYGGIEEKTTPYHKFSNKRPKDERFFNLLKCNIGQRAGGFFDNAFWTKKVFTPYALSLRVGAAAEATEEDKRATIEIMESVHEATIKIMKLFDIAERSNIPKASALPIPDTERAYNDTVAAPVLDADDDEGIGRYVVATTAAVAFLAIIAINLTKKE